MFFIIVDKKKAKESGWQSSTILKKSYLRLLEVFAQHVKKVDAYVKGKILVESDPAQDLYLIQAHNRLQSMGTQDQSISHDAYKKMITSLSLVNKENLDIDIQIADALAPIAGLKYLVYKSRNTKKINSMEKMKLRLIDRKLADKNNPSFFEVLL